MRLYDEIKQNINCIELAAELGIELHKNGGTYRCPSFIHEGHNPNSVMVSEDSWFSFSDGVGGDVTDMLAYAKYDGDKSMAFKDMCHRFNLAFNDTEYKQNYREWNNAILQWHNELTEEDIEYLHKRKIKDSTINNLYIGSHVFKEKSPNGEMVDVPRIIIPIFKNNSCVYYCARNRSQYNVVKYKKPYLEEAFKENTLYGLDTLNRSETYTDNDTIVIAEGVFDFLTFYQEGYRVLSSATRLSNKQTEYLCKIAKKFKRVAICYDNDGRGVQFTTATAKQLFEHNIPFDIVNIPREYGKDVSDCYCAGISPVTLLNDHMVDGTLWYLKTTMSDMDELMEYVYKAHSPYMSRVKKKAILQYAKEFLGADGEEMKEIRRELTRGKTNDEYAHEFIASYDYKLRCNPSLGFYRFNGTYWSRCDDALIRQGIMEMFDVSFNLESAILNKVRTIVYDDTLPNQVNCLNLKNGTLYFTENPFDGYYRFTRKRNPDDFNDYVLNYEYRENAYSQDWEDFLSSTTSSDEKLIKRFAEYFGSVFMEHSIQDKAYLFYGNGSNGKSVLTKVLSALLGDGKLCSTLELSRLGGRFDTLQLLGKYVNFCHEATSDIKEAEPIFKAITSNDVISTDVKGKPRIEFKPRCKIFIDCNELPRANKSNGGWLRRFEGTKHKFNNTFTTDESRVDDIHVFRAIPGIDTLLTSDDVLPAVLWWSIGGYVRLIENGYKFSEIDEDKDLEYEFAIESNHVIEFLNEFDWVDNGMTLTSMRANRVYEIYKEWCDECRYRVAGRNTFYKNLKGAIAYFDGTETPHCELKSIRKQWFLVKK
jgi:P4 family phage/plasmid primase-like protien